MKGRLALAALLFVLDGNFPVLFSKAAAITPRFWAQAR